MIELKYWYDFNKDRQESSKMLIIYGAAYSGQGFLKAGIIPDFFCDKQARSMERVICEDGSSILVVLPEELPRSEDADILVATLCNDKEMIKFIVDDVAKSMDSETNRLRFYLEPSKDLYDITYYEIGNKIVVFDYAKYATSLAKRTEKEKGAETAFFDVDLPFSERWAFWSDVKICFKNNRLEYKDLIKEYISFKNGKRVTTDQPENFVNTIHIFGDSRVENMVCKDEDTLCSQLQRFINKKNYAFRVENCALGGLRIPGIVHQIRHTELRHGDYVFVVDTLETTYETGNILEDTEIFCTYLKEFNEYCKLKGCYFIFIRIERLLGKPVLTVWEERILNMLKCRNYHPDYSFSGRRNIYLENEKKSIPIKIYCGSHGIMYYDCVSQLYTSEVPIFYDGSHWGDYGNKILAEEIYQIICSIENIKVANKMLRSHIEKRIEQDKAKAILDLLQRAVIGCDDYLKQIRKYKREDAKYAGAVVMNCNPFTKGHRYLIEKAALQVDVLYLFVVEEDKSIFPFADRFKLINENTKDITNVVVLPSGRFIISSVTFPDYFYKESILENQETDASLDLLIFALKIAKEMDIKVRFVGEEPFDFVTRRYNEQMKQILSEYDIEVVEMERVRNKENVISASTVRVLLQEGKFEELEKYVPQATYRYLMEKKEKFASFI